MRRSRRTFALALVVVLSLGLAACGDDDETETGADDTETTEAAAGEHEEYCEVSLKLETLPEPDIDFDALTPEQQQEELKKFITAEVLPLVDEIEPLVPEEIQAEGKLLIDNVREIARTGNVELFEAEPVQAAEAKTHAFDLENCGWNASNVTAVDYAYQGLSAELETGTHSFDMQNTGKEFHMIAIIRKNDDTTETFDQLLELPEEEAEKKTTFLGEASSEPGDSDYLVVGLTPGEYLAICFIPVGSTQAAHDAGQEPQGPPHFTQGMKTEFTVA